MRKIFLDCGTHYGQGLSEFIKLKNIDRSWEIYSWEANPFTFNGFVKDEFLKKYNVTFYNQAISTVDGHIELNVETTKDGNHTGQGSSIIELDKWQSPMHKGVFLQKVNIPCIDFSNYLLKEFNKDDLIILKMDIEGAEYSVLEKMIKDSSADFINEIYVEWHSRFFPNRDEYKEKEYSIIDALKSKGVLVNNWI